MLIEFENYEIHLGTLGVADVRLVGNVDRKMDGTIDVMPIAAFVESTSLLKPYESVNVFHLLPPQQIENVKARLMIAYLQRQGEVAI